MLSANAVGYQAGRESLQSISSFSAIHDDWQAQFMSDYSVKRRIANAFFEASA
jgi:hypothetical protein